LEFQRVCKAHGANPERGFNQLLKSRGRKQLQGLCAFFQTPVGNQSHEAKYMVAMQVADKNLVAAIGFEAVLKNLHLSAFPTINEEIVVVHLHQLCGVMSAVKRATCGVSKNGDVHKIERGNALPAPKKRQFG
jgi:hypothetical protein